MPSAIQIWWDRNRAIIYLIPTFSFLILLVLYSSRFPSYLQSYVILTAVVAAGGALGGIIAISTVRNWQPTFFEVQCPQLSQPAYLPIVNSPVPDVIYLGEDRWETRIHLQKPYSFEKLFGGEHLNTWMYKIRSHGKLFDRTHFGDGLVFADGMPVNNSHHERLIVAPLDPEGLVEDDTYGLVATFDLICSVNGDYEWMTRPEVQQGMAWLRSKYLEAKKKADLENEDEFEVDVGGLKDEVFPELSPETPSLPEPEMAAEKIMQYCVKCREKRPMNDPKEVVMKNGKPAVKGVCSVCGAKMMRMGAMPKAEVAA